MAKNESEDGWSYNPEGTSGEPATTDLPVSWTASEFISNQKSTSWYVGFFIFISACCTVIYLLTKDLISVITIAIVGILFSVLANKKPKQVAYEVSANGIAISSRFYPYSDFKSFSLSGEGVIGSINLMPLKRFMPEITIYFPPEEGDKIIDILSDQLPHEERKEHSVDKLMNKLKF